MKLREEEIIESFIRSGGPGGQNINKVATGVYLRHIPTGIEVKCTTERTQSLNRVRAREILAAKIDSLARKKEREERQRIEKARRQKRKRSKAAKERMLKEKRFKSLRKALRKKVEME